MSSHALFSPSAAERWMQCPASARINYEAPRTSNAAADEGTTAHELAQLCLERNWDATDLPVHDDWSEYPEDMRGHVQDYIDYVRDRCREVDGALHVEQRLDMTEYVPDCYGTADAVIVHDGGIIVIDLKYGKGIRVEAHGNPQLRLYGLGAASRYLWEAAPDTRVETVVYQPRLDHVDEAEYTVAELIEFGMQASQRAELGLRDDAPYGPSEGACRWCHIRATCKARAEHALAVAQTEFGETPAPAELSLDDIASLLPRLKSLTDWCRDVEAHALSQALQGHQVIGYKVVEGRSNRRWIEDAPDVLLAHEKADLLMPRKPVTVTDAEKILGKKDPTLLSLLENPQGKPTLAPESDKRPPMQGVETAKTEFAD